MNKQFNICQTPFVYFMVSGSKKKKNPKEARELSHRCQHRLVAEIKGSDFKELGKTSQHNKKDGCCRKGQKLRSEKVEISQLLLGVSKVLSLLSNHPDTRCVLLFCARDPKLILSPTPSPSHQQCH